MRAILINPEDRSITEINIDKGIHAIYNTIDCDTFSAPVTYENGDTIYCDDEGLFKPMIGGIYMINWAHILFGKVLVIGCDIETGESKDVETSIDFFENHIIWINKEDAEKYVSENFGKI